MKNNIAQTNEQSFKSLLKDLHQVELAILRERILKIMELTIEDIEINPTDWEKEIVQPNIFINLNEKIQKHLGRTKAKKTAISILKKFINANQ